MQRSRLPALISLTFSRTSMVESLIWCTSGRCAVQALEELGLRQTVAPPPQPTYNTKFDVYRCATRLPRLAAEPR